MPTDMEMWTEIRRRVLVEDVSKRQTRRDHGISSKTLDKVLGHTEPTRGRALFGASAGPTVANRNRPTLTPGQGRTRA